VLHHWLIRLLKTRLGEGRRLTAGTLEESTSRSGDTTLRGAAATSNTGAREWMRRYGKRGGQMASPMRKTADEAHSEVFVMSGVASYKTNFATLGAIAFFGKLCSSP